VEQADMLIVVEWLQEFLSQQLSVTRIEHALGRAGLEVEESIRPPEFDEGIIAATVEAVKPHPEADKLQLATVTTGGEQYEIVCGAPNLFEGQRAVLALVGATLPDGTQIQETSIRGTNSQGMLCSQRELGLGESQEGILDLGPEVEPGTPLGAIYDENYTVIEVNTPTNRWDTQSYFGIAREVAAHAQADYIFDIEQQPDSQGERVDTLFENHAPEAVPCYGLARLQLGEEAGGDSPEWMQRRLRFHGLKPVGMVVDITNYAMLVTGQPLHAFDDAAISGQVQVRFAESGEVLTTLDGVERNLGTSDLVIADDQNPIALAGVMGGQHSQIEEGSSSIALEAASFDSALVRATAKRHGTRTEASARFERGIPMRAVTCALRFAIGLLQKYAGAQVTAYQTERNRWPWVQHIGVPASRAAALSGLDDLDPETIARELQKLDFEARPFDIAAEARQHLGKPYKWGATFKTDGTQAFDCSYLVDYLYSLVGVNIGHTALAQYEHGTPVETDELRPGDVVFYEGPIVNSSTDHYYLREADGSFSKHQLPEEKHVGHNGVYAGSGKVITAAQYVFQDGEWVERDQPGVIEVELSEFTSNGGYLGARRYLDDPDDLVTVTVPWWRPDVKLLEDVIEEVVKLIGLDEIPATLPTWHPRQFTPDEYWSRLNQIRWLLYGLGLFEVTTYPFISEDDITTFNLDSEHLKLANPRSQEQAYLRVTLLPLLSRTIAGNAGYAEEFGVFEMARVFIPETDQSLPREPLKLGIAAQADTVLRVKHYLDQLLAHTGINADIEPEHDNPFLHPARRAAVRVTPHQTSPGAGDESMGWFGELHPDIQEALKSRHPILYAELDVDVILRHWQTPEFHALPDYPSGYRDLTVLVSPATRWRDIHRSLSTIDDVVATFRDEYHRDADTKAVTIHLELLAHEATLTHQRIQERLDHIQDVLAREHEARIE
jgi:phenylalanyl-tRNA synthetase beta subunit